MFCYIMLLKFAHIWAIALNGEQLTSDHAHQPKGDSATGLMMRVEAVAALVILHG